MSQLLSGWFSLRIEPQLLERMRALARRDGVTMADQVRRGLEWFLAQRGA